MPTRTPPRPSRVKAPDRLGTAARTRRSLRPSILGTRTGAVAADTATSRLRGSYGAATGVGVVHQGTGVAGLRVAMGTRSAPLD